MNETTWLILTTTVGVLIGGCFYTHPILAGIVGFVVGAIIVKTPRDSGGLGC